MARKRSLNGWSEYLRRANDAGALTAEEAGLLLQFNVDLRLAEQAMIANHVDATYNRVQAALDRIEYFLHAQTGGAYRLDSSTAELGAARANGERG